MLLKNSPYMLVLYLQLFEKIEFVETLRDAVGSLVTIPEVLQNGKLKVCPGDSISITCTHHNIDGETTRWLIQNATTSSCDVFVSHSMSVDLEVCSPFTVTQFSNNSGSDLTSTIEAIVASPDVLDGTTVKCFAGGHSESLQVGSVSVSVREFWITNITTQKNGTIVRWYPLSNSDYQSCITGYSISWNGGQYNTTDASTSVTREVLHQHGFPYCQTQAVTVTPFEATNKMMFAESAKTSFITLIRPGFSALSLLASFTELLEMKIQLIKDNESNITVHGRSQMYGFVHNNSTSLECIPTTPFNGSSVNIPLEGARAEDVYTVCVRIQDGDCIKTASITKEVPPRKLSIRQKKVFFQVNIDLPLTPHSPSELLIISSLSPPHDRPTTTTFPSSTLQHTVTFTNLTPGVEYTYTIRVVLANDRETDVVPSATGTFDFTILNGNDDGTLLAVFISALVVGTIISLILFIVLALLLGIILGKIKFHHTYFLGGNY